ncbi:decaprenyl-phosphate phosphoribosyltransferase [Patescibacteria group bacterium]|nr:decaprenyl-phosphate phosphoribosyltransferase [Patescibacteria group bacterium]MBU1868729.1 decaprenyl-phosphate phosphoribosyltransferase [Patescibacteria group bacterium]
MWKKKSKPANTANSQLKNLLTSMRPKQWIKNVFVFAPVIFGLKLYNADILARAMATFFLFTCTAAGVYLINDVIDLEKDKQHPLKKNRPIASGKLKIRTAIISALVLYFIALFLSLLLDPIISLILIAYASINLLYSKLLKQMVIVDAMCFALFFMLRLVSGGVAAQVALSHWIIICTALLALLIAFGKRYHELDLLNQRARAHRTVLERYTPLFLEQMMAVITAALVISYTLYTVDTNTLSFFGSKNIIFTVPFVYYGVFRYLYNIYHLKRGGDPTEILLTDEKLQIDIFLWALLTIVIIYF